MNSRPLVVPASNTVEIWLAEALNQPQLPFVVQVGRKCFLFIKFTQRLANLHFFLKKVWDGKCRTHEFNHIQLIIA